MIEYLTLGLIAVGFLALAVGWWGPVVWVYGLRRQARPRLKLWAGWVVQITLCVAIAFFLFGWSQTGLLSLLLPVLPVAVVFVMVALKSLPILLILGGATALATVVAGLLAVKCTRIRRVAPVVAFVLFAGTALPVLWTYGTKSMCADAARLGDVTVYTRSLRGQIANSFSNGFALSHAYARASDGREWNWSFRRMAFYEVSIGLHPEVTPIAMTPLTCRR